MRWGRRFAVLAVMIAALSGVASSQAVVGAIISIAEGVNTLVIAARSTYQAARYMIDATDGVEPPPGTFDHVLDPDERQLLIEQWRYETLSNGLRDLQAQVAAAEANIIREIQTGFDEHEQRDFTLRAYGNSEVILIFARQTLRPRTPEERAAQMVEARIHAQTLTRDSSQAARMSGNLGPQFVGALHSMTQALRALRAAYPGRPDQDTLDYFVQIANNLDVAAEHATGAGSYLRRSAAAEGLAYRQAVVALSRAGEVRSLVRYRTPEDAERPASDREYVFQYDRPARACFEVAIAWESRPCRGDECGGNPFGRVDAPTRFRQSRFDYTITRTTVGSGASAINMLGGLRPDDLTPDVTQSNAPEQDCPWQGTPRQAWLDAAHFYNEAMQDAAAIGRRAAVYNAALELNAKTRSELARLQASWQR